MPEVNDIHSRLNRTDVAEVLTPRDQDELLAAVREAAGRGLPVAIAGGRHAMGGQQFCSGGLLIDTTVLKRPLAFDAERGLLEMEAGAHWPDVIAATHALQEADGRWGIRQKQTGADALSLGGSIAANGHGRGLLMRPMVDDVEALTVITGDGQRVRCSRDENAELFSLVVGGYGLFGVIGTVTLRLGPRLRLRRMVNILDVEEAVPAFYRRVSEGCLYGDFQYAIDPSDRDFLRRGVLACYGEAPPDAEVADARAGLDADKWIALLRLALTDKKKALQVYSQHYLSTHGNVYWSDTMQLSTYVPSYAEVLEQLASSTSAPTESLVIGEVYAPPERILELLERSRGILRATQAEDIYGTIRAIREDDTSFLAWARQDYGCVIFNLRTQHTAEGRAHTADVFRRLYDTALDLGGSFFLTYSRAATREQVERGYPNFPEFLRLKRHYDPELRFQSEWWRHYAPMFA
ncbi:MAG TPA: FAD-binding oxidoreductase [Gemmatimonadota bacterium]|nr:FAD-binding oxidoreductase [Gemmatimonadota bacterium]